MNLLGGIDWKMIVMRKMTNSLYMICMVMGNEHGIYVCKHHSPLLQVVP
jgi:hypothetical protein